MKDSLLFAYGMACRSSGHWSLGLKSINSTGVYDAIQANVTAHQGRGSWP